MTNEREDAVLEQRGWDVRDRGLAGGPPIGVVAGRLRHVTVDRALRLLGIGASQLVVVPSDAHGRMSPASEAPTRGRPTRTIRASRRKCLARELRQRRTE